MFCTNCGNQISEGSKFCPNCGAHLPDASGSGSQFRDTLNGAAAAASDFADDARDINIACNDDDEETGGLGMYILLSIVTCGFYAIWWEYKLGNRLQKNAPYYGLSIQENGTTIILWRLLGSLLCFVGTFVGSYILIKNVNLICDAYNRKYGLTPNMQ